MSNIPSSNILADALTLICPQPFLFHRFVRTRTNDFGIDVRTYSTPIQLEGSIQAIERRFYSDFGLDFNRRYIAIWSTDDINDLYRDRSGDQIGWDRRLWEVVGETEWFQVDGWNSIIAVQVSGTDADIAFRSWAFGNSRSNFNNSNFYRPI